ncbi:unnamed protein product, partial [Amoebophrya sp. A120]|eukprot:GSA120T00001067001.1
MLRTKTATGCRRLPPRVFVNEERGARAIKRAEPSPLMASLCLFLWRRALPPCAGGGRPLAYRSGARQARRPAPQDSGSPGFPVFGFGNATRPNPAAGNSRPSYSKPAKCAPCREQARGAGRLRPFSDTGGGHTCASEKARGLGYLPPQCSPASRPARALPRPARATELLARGACGYGAGPVVAPLSLGAPRTFL